MKITHNKLTLLLLLFLMLPSLSIFSYAVGFALVTALLRLCRASLALWIQKLDRTQWIRLPGLAIALVSVSFC